MHHPALVEEGEIVAKAVGQVEVVEHHDGVHLEAPNQREHLVLVADIEMVGGLVEQHHRTLLGDASGDHHPLAFPAGQLLKAALGEARQAHQLERVERDAAVFFGEALMVTAMNVAAQQHELTHGDADPVGGGILSHDCDRTRNRSRRQRVDLFVVDEHRAPVGAQHPVQAAQQRRLAAAVGPDEAHYLSGTRAELRLRQDIDCAEPQIDVGGREHGPAIWRSGR